MKATKTTTITVEINGQTFQLSETEARELAHALNGALGIPESVTVPLWPTPEYPRLPPVTWQTQTATYTPPHDFATVSVSN